MQKAYFKAFLGLICELVKIFFVKPLEIGEISLINDYVDICLMAKMYFDF